MRARQVTLSSAASSQVRIGSGTTEQTNIWKGLGLRPRSIIPWTSPYQDQPDGSPPTGKTFWWGRDLAMGRDSLGVRKSSNTDGRNSGLPEPRDKSRVISFARSAVVIDTARGDRICDEDLIAALEFEWRSKRTRCLGNEPMEPGFKKNPSTLMR